MEPAPQPQVLVGERVTPAVPVADEGVLRPPVVSILETPALSQEIIAAPKATFAPPRLQITSLGIDHEIVSVPIRDGRWDVSELGGNVGWLEATGVRPLQDETPVLVGHMTFANDQLLTEGAFASLQEIRLGAEIVYLVAGERYRYEVVHVGRVAPHDVESLFTADGKTLLLLTCTDWSETSWSYENRLLVRAVLRDQS